VLSVRNMTAGYGNKPVLTGVSLDVFSGEIVALFGHNGVGKTTFLNALFGLVRLSAGVVSVRGRSLVPTPLRMIRNQMGYIPQGSRVFSELTVSENLDVACAGGAGQAQQEEAVASVLELFPHLKGRLKQRAGTLSGGERQMLAMSSCLVTNPGILLLDEPSLGLAPSVISRIFSLLRELRSKGKTILIVEQRVREVLQLADRFYLLHQGSITYSGATADVREADLGTIFL